MVHFKNMYLVCNRNTIEKSLYVNSKKNKKTSDTWSMAFQRNINYAQSKNKTWNTVARNRNARCSGASYIRTHHNQRWQEAAADALLINNVKWHLQKTNTSRRWRISPLFLFIKLLLVSSERMQRNGLSNKKANIFQKFETLHLLHPTV